MNTGMRPTTRRVALLISASTFAALAGLAWRLHSSIRNIVESQPNVGRALRFDPVKAPALVAESWGTGDILALAKAPSGLFTAGGSGVFEDGRPASGLPTLRASALTLWRNRPVVALAAGGFFARVNGHWEEAHTGWGTLHVRTLAETPGGELILGAREGLYRAAWGGRVLDRLDLHPVRTLALGAGFILSGGEDGLYRVEASRALGIPTPDPWVESVALVGNEVLAVTAAGLARGPSSGPLTAVAGGEDLVSGALNGGSFYGTDGRSAAVYRRDLETDHVAEEAIQVPPRRLFTSGGEIFADTSLGLFRRIQGRWALLPRSERSLPGSGHVSALTSFNGRIVVGLFDGGVVVGGVKSGNVEWRQIEGAAAWGVNALLPAGGVVYVASLRGASRFDGTKLEPLAGPGAAFSLATLPEGVVIGYGEGVLLPGSRLLSAFHGLPGNQALALVSGQDLFVGTPSGLGAVQGRRVRWRVGSGEGKLPHPWVTALVLADERLYVGTYGGGIARRTPTAPGDPGRFEPFAETEGLKISALLAVGSRIWAGTDGAGLYRSSLDRQRFERLEVSLPSPHVTALTATNDSLFIGTDEGLARLPLAEVP